MSHPHVSCCWNPAVRAPELNNSSKTDEVTASSSRSPGFRERGFLWGSGAPWVQTPFLMWAPPLLFLLNRQASQRPRFQGRGLALTAPHPDQGSQPPAPGSPGFLQTPPDPRLSQNVLLLQEYELKRVSDLPGFFYSLQVENMQMIFFL